MNGVSYAIDDGELLCMLGHNGAGKSTLLKIISGILKPTSGFINSNIDILSNSSYVFQKPIFLKRTVRENIDYILSAKKFTGSKKIINDYLTYYKLNHLSDILAHNLSLGEQQLVSFIRAIIIKPRIIFLDEPTSNLDRDYKEMINNEISKMSRNIKVFMITQNDTESRIHTKYPIILEKGRCL